MSQHYLYDYEGVGFNKLEKIQLGLLLDLKHESWQTTHNVSLLNYENQLNWYDGLVAQDIHTPKTIVLVANAEVGTSFESFGIFKFTNIDWYNRKADAAWDVFSYFRKKGLGRRLVVAGVNFARDVLALRKLNAEILENNQASAKCALAAGFVKEGVKREEVYRSGKYLDSVLFGLLISPRQSKTASSS